jgi:hypothetical protein
MIEDIAETAGPLAVRHAPSAGVGDAASALHVRTDHPGRSAGLRTASGFFTTLGAAGLTGVLAALAVVLLAGGYTTMRRVTV